MPKMKSHSGAKKRFKKTARGKWLHKKAGTRHLLAGWKSKIGRKKRRSASLTKTEGKLLNRFLPYGR